VHGGAVENATREARVQNGEVVAAHEREGQRIVLIVEAEVLVQVDRVDLHWESADVADVHHHDVGKLLQVRVQFHDRRVDIEQGGAGGARRDQYAGAEIRFDRSGRMQMGDSFGDESFEVGFAGRFESEQFVQSGAFVVVPSPLEQLRRILGRL
jgi:hypothetical protein